MGVLTTEIQNVPGVGGGGAGGRMFDNAIGSHEASQAIVGSGSWLITTDLVIPTIAVNTIYPVWIDISSVNLEQGNGDTVYDHYCAVLGFDATGGLTDPGNVTPFQISETGVSLQEAGAGTPNVTFTGAGYGDGATNWLLINLSNGAGTQSWVKAKITLGPAMQPGFALSCFVAGTLVHTPRGLVAIEGLKVGDEVLSYCLESRERTGSLVIGTRSAGDRPVYKLQAGSATLLVTAEHPFYEAQSRKWVPLHRLEPDVSHLFLVNGSSVRVDDIMLERTETVYNLTVEGQHNYYVGETGVLVHNK